MKKNNILLIISFGATEKICIHHGQALMFFCETCEEPICNQCAILGPHNNQVMMITFKIKHVIF
jgi:hypothetical protein